MESPLLNPDAHKAQRPKMGLSLMLVDPQPESRALLKAAIRSIESVESVRESSTVVNIYDILAGSQVDVILIEENIHDVDVFGLVREVKGNPKYRNVRFVLMSNSLDTESRRKGMEVGILGYLAKPFDINSLERAIKDSMGKVSTNHKETLNKIRKIDFFTDFTDLELVRLLKICHTRKFSVGENIFGQGEIGDRLFVMVMGHVDIIKESENGDEFKVASVHPGDVFGEMALVDKEPRSATARAGVDCMIIEVNEEIINDINDILALKLFRKIAMLVTKKLRDFTNARVNPV